jgi:hypothetical protein
MEIFNELFSKYNYLERSKKPSITIEDIESTVNFKLPLDYISYLQKYLGFEGFIGKEYLQLWDIDELLETNRDYGIFQNLPKTLAIGGNGNGEFIAIESADQGNYRVVLSPFIDLNSQSHIEVGTSFTNFLNRLDNGHEWFK